ncbi:POTE ankyrin domain family member J-like isoform X2 [Hydractinia symbiolongicarpus]|uniref:POTE ankyrin domain family member J-like isoform X2 n=1 Tax=Hydractinia symbiolongicarpus TaxID=13093 RepID=UPI00254F054A|nr:POTE ankyrin domain family member J-like isoform X2 [Hydractinia symbiolongicarpus]
MGHCASKQIPDDTTKANEEQQGEEDSGVLLACHQKFKRRGGKEGKKDTKTQSDSSRRSAQKEKKEASGVRKRGKKNDQLEKSTEEMGIFQSKAPTKDAKKSLQHEPVQLTITVQNKPLNGSLDFKIEKSKDKQDSITSSYPATKNDKKLQNETMTNHGKDILSNTSQGAINGINYPLVVKNAEKNVVTSEKSLKQSKIVDIGDENCHIGLISDSAKTVDTKVETSKENNITNSIEEEYKMRYTVDDARIGINLKSLPQRDYIKEETYLTIEEKVVCEEYDDGMRVTKTIITEIPETQKESKIDKTENFKNILDTKLNIQEFADEMSSSVLQSAFEKSTHISEETSKFILNKEMDKMKFEKRPRDICKFKMFVLNKYAERLLAKTMKTSVNDAIPELKQKAIFSTIYANSLANGIINEVLQQNMQQTKNTTINNIDSNENTKNFTIDVDSNFSDLISDKQLDSFANELVEILLNNDTLTKEIKVLQSETDRVHDVSDNISKKIINMTFQDLENKNFQEPISVEHDKKDEQLYNGTHTDEQIDADLPEKEVTETPKIILNDVVNKEMTLSVSTSGDLKVIDTDENQNNIDDDTDGSCSKVILRKKTAPATDRPLSGFAEKLAELLAEEDDLDFLDSDEELQESLEKIKTNFGPKRKISIEVNNMQRRFSEKEICDYHSTNLKSKVAVKLRNKQNKFKGDRPMSLYEQDMLADILNDEDDDEEEENDDEIKSNEEYSDEETEEEEDDVLEDEILPVKETAVLLENTIPFTPVTLNFSVTNDYEVQLDEVTRGPRKISMAALGTGKPPSLQRAVVIDTGCGAIKAGFCGDVKPQCYCPSVIGVPRRFSQDVSKMKKAYYVGDEAWPMAGMLQIEHPIKQNITNWPDVTNMIEYVLEHELKVNDNQHPVLMTEMGLTSKKHRERLSEVMFETFGVPAFFLANQSSLAMYSMGMMSGICLNSGFYNTQATAIYEGHSIPHGTIQLDIGGDHVTNQLGRALLANQGIGFNTSSEKLVLNSMKQSLCYVAEDAKIEQESYKTKLDKYEMYTLPDGQEIELGAERCLATEILFDPQMLGLHQPNTAELIEQSIKSMDVELHSLLSQNVLVTGGNSKLSGYGSRLEKELLQLLRDAEHDICINYADDPLLSSWIGGSILSSISVFRDQWVTIDQYAEQGAKVVHTVCF